MANPWGLVTSSGSGGLLVNGGGLSPQFSNLFAFGDSYADNVGNYVYLSTAGSSFTPIANGPSYIMDVGASLSQSGVSIGRYTPPGGFVYPSTFNSTVGTNYAIAGSSIGSNTVLGGHPNCLKDQYNQFLTDYPSGPPNNSVIFISIGINDIILALSTGGQFPLANTTWTINGAQTLGASSTNLVVNSSTGASVGSGTNYISFPLSSGGTALCPITAVPDGTHITINSTGFGSSTVSNGTTIVTGSQAGFTASLQQFLTTLFTTPNISNCYIIWTSPPDVNLLPQYASGNNLIHWTWSNYIQQFNALINQPTFTGISLPTSPFNQLRVFDLQWLYTDLQANPLKYGIPNTTSGWNSSSSNAQSYYFFWDNYHPNPWGFRIIANYLMQNFVSWGFAK